jgi:hypothetical protein
MATSFGYCPNCGAAQAVPAGRFCAACCAALAAAPLPPPPPAVPAGPPPVAPPAWSMPPGAAPVRQGINPLLLVVAAVVVVAIAAFVVVSNNSGGSGGITFSPSTLSCKTPVVFTTTARLPASVHASDTIAITLDGKSAGTSTVVDSSGDTKQQPDGSWLSVSTTTAAQMQSLCAAGGSAGGMNVLTPGTHTMQVLDASGKVLAQGSYTVTP